MKEILESMDSLAPQLKKLETLMAGDVHGRNIDDLLGANPKLGFSKLVEFKVALDRMRGLTWVYMEAAASAGKLPAQRIPQVLKESLQQQATKAHTSQGSKKNR